MATEGHEGAVPPELARSEQWRQRFHFEAERRWLHSRFTLAIIAAILLFTLALAFLGFAVWRVALSVSTSAILATILLTLRSETPGAVRAFQWLFPSAFIALSVGIVLTGGARSPLLVLVLAFPGLLILRDFSRATKANLAILVTSATVAALAGSSVGPPIPDPWHSFFSVVFLLLGLALSVSHVTTMTRSLNASTRELDWARAKEAEQVTARAQELELFTSRLSHELKNPLTAIKALVQVSLRTSTEEEPRERLVVMDGEIDRMGAILQDYLTFARPLAPLSLAPRELHRLVDDVLAVLDARAQDAGVRLERVGEATAVVDERRVKEALVNLVDNAIAASSSHQVVQVSLAQEAGAILLTVEDHGHGMPPEVLAKLGTPFFTTRARGNGLGVMVARGIFRQHGGSLEFKSVVGAGTAASGTLPVGGEEVADGTHPAGR